MDVYDILITIAITVALIHLTPVVLTRGDINATLELASGTVGTIGGWVLFGVSVAHDASINLAVTILFATIGFAFVCIGVNRVVSLPWRVERQERHRDIGNKTS